MRGRIIPFSATHNDLVEIMREATSERPLDFIVGMNDLEPKPLVLASVEDIRPFEQYIIIDSGVPIKMETVNLRKGGVRYYWDESLNPHANTLITGGQLNLLHVLYGQLGTMGADRRSKEIFRLLKRLFRKRSELISSIYVGSEAAAIMESGGRLSHTAKSPLEYDLRR